MLENILKYIYIVMKYTWTESDLDTENSLRPCRKCLCRLSVLAQSNWRGYPTNHQLFSNKLDWAPRQTRAHVGCRTYFRNITN